MQAFIVTYLKKNNTRVQVLVLRDEATIFAGTSLHAQVAATDEDFGQLVGIEKLSESTVVFLC